MHPEEKRDWQIFLFPMCYVVFMFVTVFIGLSNLPPDSLGAIGPFGFPVMTIIWVLIPFIISCFAPVIIAYICIQKMPDEDAKI